MPVGKCTGCGHETNSYTSDWWDRRDFIPTRCYVRWIAGKPEKGCAFDKADDYEKAQALKIIANYRKGRFEQTACPDRERILKGGKI